MENLSKNADPLFLWPEMPILSGLVSQLYQLLKSLGILLRYTGIPESRDRHALWLELDSLTLVFSLAFKAAYHIAGAPRVRERIPAIFLAPNFNHSDGDNFSFIFSHTETHAFTPEAAIARAIIWKFSLDHEETIPLLLISNCSSNHPEISPIEAIDYVLDLSNEGYLFPEKSAVKTIYLLSILHCFDLNICDLLNFYDQKSKHLEPTDLLAGRSLSKSKVKILFEHLLNHFHKAANSTRSSENIEEFLTSQSHVSLAVLILFKFYPLLEGRGRTNPTLKSIYSQIEEIGCDCVAIQFATIFSEWIHFPQNDGTMMTAWWTLFHYAFGDNWQEFLRRERLTLPDDLVAYSLKEVSGTPEPDAKWEDNWLTPPLDLIKVLSILHGNSPWFWRREPFTLEEISTTLEWKEFFADLELSETLTSDIIIQKLYHQNERYVLGLPDETRKLLRTRLRCIHENLTIDFNKNTLTPIISTNDNLGEKSSLIVATLESFRKLYPGHPGLLLELAIALDYSGAPGKAKEVLTEAIIANPAHHFLWKSLSVAVSRLGNHDKDLLALRFMSKVLNEELQEDDADANNVI